MQVATGACASEGSSACVAINEGLPLLTAEHEALRLRIAIRCDFGAVDDELGAVTGFDFTAGGLDFDRDLLALVIAGEGEVCIHLALRFHTLNGAPAQVLTDSAFKGFSDCSAVLFVGVLLKILFNVSHLEKSPFNLSVSLNRNINIAYMRLIVNTFFIFFRLFSSA